MAHPSERIRVAHIIARLNIGGPATHVTLLTSRFPAERFDTRLVVGDISPGEAEITDVLASENVDPVRISGLGRALHAHHDVQALAGLVSDFRRFRPHIVHTHTAKAGALGRIAAVMAGVPIIIHTFHGHVFEGYFSRATSQAFLAIERSLTLVTDAIVTISPRQYADITGRFHVAPPQRTHVIPLGVGFGVFDTVEARRGELRREIGCGDAPLVSIVGRLTPIKDHALLLRALAELPAVHLCVVGGGESDASLRALAKELGIASRTHFLGFRTDLDRVLADTDVVALTSLNEGTPVALIEAMAAGCSIVATSVGGVPDVLEEGRWGTLVRSRDSGEVAQALRGALAAHRSRSSESIASAKRYAGTKYGLERLVRDHADLYEALLAESNERPLRRIQRGLAQAFGRQE